MTNSLLVKRLLLLSAGVALGWSTYARATLDLSTIPLVVSGVADPNVMFLMDTSGSMAHILIESSSTSTYDATDTTWNTCDASLTLSSADVTKVELKISLSTDTPAYKPWFTTSGSVAGDFDWGNATTSETGTTGKPVRCFAPDQTFPAQLSVDLATALPSGTVHGTMDYSGHYLNYYFGSALDVDWTGSHHPDEHSRMQAAQTSFDSLITSMDSVRAGLSRLEGELGAHVLQPVAALTDTHKTALQGAADNLSPNGYTSTPLADVFHKLGHYFVGSYSGDLTLHPDSTSPVTKAASTVFHKLPTYADGIDQTSPIGSDAFCRQNFIIAVTGGEPTAATEISEASGLRTYNDAACPDCTTHMDDVAKALFDMDLRPDIGTDFKNNIRTFLLGLASSTSTLFTKTAEAGGTGEPYFMDDADQLLVEFNSVMSTIHAQNGSVASVAFNASQLNSDSAVYQAKFNTGRWSGSLIALPLSDTGAIAESATWDAAVKLDDETPANRNIMTRGFVDPAVDNTIGGTEFTWANLTAAQKDDLGYTSEGTDATIGQDVLNYLRGDRSKEGSATGDFRVRDSRLGDIVNSTPVFVGAPELNWPDYYDNNLFGGPDSDTTDTHDDGSYSYYKHMTVADGGAADRAQVIYAGANDGMLHGFNARLTDDSGAIDPDGGKEVFAYIPNSVYSSGADDGLHYLADRHYAHRFYVDLTPTVSDVYIDPAGGTSPSWRTILIGGLGAGGRGLFALDITDPTRFSDLGTYADDILLWEFTNGDNTGLGYTFSRPTVAMMPNGKWAVIVGNGYNSDDATAKLFILFIEDGLDGWSAGDYVVLDTKVGTADAPNGLSTPRVVDLTGNSVADRIYVGDLHGNMWAFNVSSGTVSDWGPAYGTTDAPLPLFTAKDSTGKAQPITAAPVARENPHGTTEEPNVLVLFGTGKFFETGDINVTDPMTFYAVWDAGTSGLLRDNLVGRAVSDSGGIRTIADGAAAIDWTTDYGWYLELSDTGERVITDSLLRRDVVFFNTVIPSDTVCEAGGNGWLMSLDFSTGLAPTFAVFDANNDGVIDSLDLGKVGYLFQSGLPTQSGMLGDKQYTPGSDGSIQERDIDIGKGTKEGTLSWEEIYKQ